MNDIQTKLEKYKKKRIEFMSEKTNSAAIMSNEEQVHNLSDIIFNMPVDKQNLLILRYVYNDDFENISGLLDIENSEGEILYLNSVFSEILELEGHISDFSMRKACNEAFERINKETSAEISNISTVRYGKFKSGLFNFPFRKKITNILLRIAVVLFLLFGANAFAEGRIFEWIVNNFEKYSEFHFVAHDKPKPGDANFKLSYIPEGFILDERAKNHTSEVYYYKKNDDFLAIKFIFGDVTSFLNTEGAKPEEFELDGTKVISWEKDEVYYFVSNKGGIGIQILGNISEKDAVLVYRGISVENN